MVFDEAAFVTETGEQQLALVLGIGTRSPAAEYVDGSGSATLRFRYVVRQGDYDDDGISIGADALVGALVEDRAGNDWEGDARRIPSVAPQSNQRVDAGEDGIAPRILALPRRHRQSHAAAKTRVPLWPAKTIEVKAVFSGGGVRHRRNPDGGSRPCHRVAEVRNAAFAAGSGTRDQELIFRYVVDAQDYDGDGLSIGPNALTGGTIVDGGGNEALRDSAASPASANAQVDGGGTPTAARIVDVLIKPPANDVFGAGDGIDVEVTFNHVVHVTDRPTITLSIGPDAPGERRTQREAARGNSRSATSCRTTTSTRTASASALALARSRAERSKTAAALADARRAFPAVRADARYRVLAAILLRPVVTDVRVTSPAGSYGIGTTPST